MHGKKTPKDQKYFLVAIVALVAMVSIIAVIAALAQHDTYGQLIRVNCVKVSATCTETAEGTYCTCPDGSAVEKETLCTVCYDSFS